MPARSASSRTASCACFLVPTNRMTRPSRELLDDLDGFAQLLDGQREIDDVDPVTLLKDERLHLGVPAARLMAEVNARFQEFAHGDDGHDEINLSGSRPRAILALRSRRGTIGARPPCRAKCLPFRASRAAAQVYHGPRPWSTSLRSPRIGPGTSLLVR